MSERRCMNCMRMIDESTAFCPHCGYGQKEEASPFGVKPGTILRGRYLAGRVLGQGGFGITYVGYDLTLDIKVAIKEYFPSGSVTRNNTVSNQVQWNTTQFNTEQWRAGCESFLKEARRMAKLDSLPGIVRVRDTFPENQTAYIVMDFVEGETLKQKLMRDGAMKFSDCLRMLRPLVESLGKMHRQGLIHRDISPDNIMVQPDGNVCLLDFGAAKDVSFQQNAASQQVAKKGFSPPEQYREKGNIGSWTDVYALCATIYYCVTGKMVPDAMDRIYEDTLTFDMPLAEPLSEAAVNALKDGLKLRSEERVQMVENLLERIENQIPKTDDAKAVHRKEEPQSTVTQDKPTAKTSAGKNKKKSKKKAVGVAAAVVIGFFVLKSMTSETSVKDDESSNVFMIDNSLDTVLGSEISRDSIVTINFTDTLDAMPDTAWDVSQEQDGSVMAWTKPHDKKYDLYIGAEGKIKCQNYCMLFTDYENVEQINFNDCFDTSQVTDMSSMFKDCNNLTGLDLSSFDTSQVTDMSFMFYDCNNLTELDLSNFDTSNVTSMYSMFVGCSNLTELDLSNFDTSNVTDMSEMFYDCNNLTKLDLSNFDTSNVTKMGVMFAGCNNLRELDLSSFDTSQVTNMSRMFYDCNNLRELDLSSFDTSQARNTGTMFAGCGITAEEAGLKLKNVLMKDASYKLIDDVYQGTVFGSEINRDSIVSVTFVNTLDSIPDTAWDVSWDQDGTVMAWTEANGESYDLFVGANGNIKGMDCNMLFAAYHNVEKINFNDCFDTSNVTNMERMFVECKNLKELDLSRFNTEKVTSMYCMFYQCEKLTELEVSRFNTENVTNIGYMFGNCVNLTKLDVSNFDMSQVTNMEGMFTNCGVTAEEAGLR